MPDHRVDRTHADDFINRAVSEAEIDAARQDFQERGRWWGPEFCMIPADEQPIMDGCYFCGRPVNGLNGEHNHTMSEKEGFRGAKQTRYSCTCESC